MRKEIGNLHQSGEWVTAPGIYALVDAPPTTDDKHQPIHEFLSDQFFPDHGGRAVCWYLIRIIENNRRKQTPITTPWQH